MKGMNKHLKVERMKLEFEERNEKRKKKNVGKEKWMKLGKSEEWKRKEGITERKIKELRKGRNEGKMKYENKDGKKWKGINKEIRKWKRKETEKEREIDRKKLRT